MAKQVEMENAIEDVKRERDELLEKSQQVRDRGSCMKVMIAISVERNFLISFYLYLEIKLNVFYRAIKVPVHCQILDLLL